MVVKRGRFGQFLACTGYPECKTTRKLIATKQGGLKAAKPDQILDEKCPRCGANLVIKQGRFGEFTACTKYPECKYVKHKTTGVKCPKDADKGGEVVERKSKRGKSFFGCSNYPGLRLRAVEPADRRDLPEVRRAVPRREDHEEARPPDPLQQRGLRLRAVRRTARNGSVDMSHRYWVQPCSMITIVGGGLAGSEAAWQAASQGVPVTLYEMRPVRPTAVHKTDRLAELVCSNSFRGDKLDNAVGLLKEEMRRLGSLVMRAAEASRVPAGAALAVDRERFAQTVTESLDEHPLITIVREEVAAIPESSERDPVIVATGPLTSEALSADIARLVGAEHLYFYDAISPIVLAESDRSREGVPRVAVGSEPRQPDVEAGRRLIERLRRAEVRPGLRRRRRGGRLPELPVDARGIRALLRRADPRRVGDRPRLRQGDLLRRLPADRGHGASRRGHAALRADEAGRPRRSAHRAARRTPPCSCGRTTSPAITTASSAFRRSSNGASRRACCG